jgi:hypothetical protein
MMLSGLATWAWATGWFSWLLVVEAIVFITVYVAMRKSLESVRWAPME